MILAETGNKGHRMLLTRDKTVGQRKPQDASHKRGAAEQEKVPVEAARLLERILPGLRRDAAHILTPGVNHFAVHGEGAGILDVRGRSRRAA